jgi:hypothetical protein
MLLKQQDRCLKVQTLKYTAQQLADEVVVKVRLQKSQQSARQQY